MADTTDAAEKKTINLSESENKILLSIMKNLTGDIPFDANAVAVDCGYKSGKTVRDVWNRLKGKKLGFSSSSATPGKKATPSKKRKDAGDDDEEENNPTPTKKARTLKAKKEEAAEVKEEEGEEE